MNKCRSQIKWQDVINHFSSVLIPDSSILYHLIRHRDYYFCVKCPDQVRPILQNILFILIIISLMLFIASWLRHAMGYIYNKLSWNGKYRQTLYVDLWPRLWLIDLQCLVWIKLGMILWSFVIISLVYISIMLWYWSYSTHGWHTDEHAWCLFGKITHIVCLIS
jgi:hypothetical protein